eukprot:gene3581-13664_t
MEVRAADVEYDQAAGELPIKCMQPARPSPAQNPEGQSSANSNRPSPPSTSTQGVYRPSHPQPASPPPAQHPGEGMSTNPSYRPPPSQPGSLAGTPPKGGYRTAPPSQPASLVGTPPKGGYRTAPPSQPGSLVGTPLKGGYRTAPPSQPASLVGTLPKGGYRTAPSTARFVKLRTSRDFDPLVQIMYPSPSAARDALTAAFRQRPMLRPGASPHRIDVADGEEFKQRRRKPLRPLFPEAGSRALVLAKGRQMDFWLYTHFVSWLQAVMSHRSWLKGPGPSQRETNGLLAVHTLCGLASSFHAPQAEKADHNTPPAALALIHHPITTPPPPPLPPLPSFRPLIPHPSKAHININTTQQVAKQAEHETPPTALALIFRPYPGRTSPGNRFQKRLISIHHLRVLLVANDAIPYFPDPWERMQAASAPDAPMDAPVLYVAGLRNHMQLKKEVLKRLLTDGVAWVESTGMAELDTCLRALAVVDEEMKSTSTISSNRTGNRTSNRSSTSAINSMSTRNATRTSTSNSNRIATSWSRSASSRSSHGNNDFRGGQGKGGGSSRGPRGGKVVVQLHRRSTGGEGGKTYKHAEDHSR